MDDKIKFFLGANSNMGFVSYFQQLQEQSDSMQLLILKGGPGSGKSTLMKRVLSHAQSLGHETQIIHCASDPQSLDAIIDKTAQFSIMDGTSPHTEDPSLPGARQHIMYTGDLWDCSLLKKNKDKIAALNTRVGDYHKAAGAYIKAAAALLEENLRLSRRHINKKVIAGYIKDAIGRLPAGNDFKESTRLLSAVSVDEIKSFPQTVQALADKIYVIEDRWGGAADYIMKALLHYARHSGTEIIHCPCSVMPQKTDHIIFPQIRTAFCTRSFFTSFTHTESICEDVLYTPPEDLPLMEKRLSDAVQLLENACHTIKEAKLLHDELEAFYAEAMDFSKSDTLFEDILFRFYR